MTMGSRRTDYQAGNIYAAADQWMERALKSDDSLFTPGKAVWTPENLAELRRRWPDTVGRGFMNRLHTELDGSRAEIYQLVGEALYIHYLFVFDIHRKTKEDRINEALGWSGQNITIPSDLATGLERGLASFGGGRSWIAMYVGSLIEFAGQWKRQDAEEEERLLKDPWAYKDFVTGLPSDYNPQHNALLHLVHPNTFEAIVAIDYKRQISEAQAFARYVTDGATDVDRRIYQIRQGLETDEGKDFHGFYDVGILHMWDPNTHFSSPWDEYISRARKYYDTGVMQTEEIDYKVEYGERLSEAREAVLNGTDDWGDQVKSRIPVNFLHPVQMARFRDWIDSSPTDARKSLQAIWARGDLPISERIRTFSGLLPRPVISGAGTRANAISALLMGLDCHNYPPFRIRLFNDAYQSTGYDQPKQGADEAALYVHALGFLDRFLEEAENRGLELRDRLDAQSIVWTLYQSIDDTDEPIVTITDTEDDEPAPHVIDLDALADKLYLTADFLEEIRALLEEKPQVIFQGPPGTGKTYVAQELAEHLSGSSERVALVQFHPSYAYEDFIEGYRPTILESGQPGFKLTDGPLKAIAKRASDDPDFNYYLIIDEINRGNIAKVFGELYFLLEYRDRHISLQYSDKLFSLPENLYIVGTMNTADRSIALVDLALRRRFNFVEFHPDDEPIKGLLRRYLDKNAPPGMEWVADVVERANEKLKDDRHAAIGPSYFMKAGLDDDAVERIWKHSVLPYVEELLFGQNDRLSEFDLDKLRQGSAQDGAENLGGSE